MLPLALLAVALAAPVPKDASRERLPNTNALLKKHTAKVVVDASSEWTGWEIIKLTDGNDQTSWFSGANDAPKMGKNPWVRATFPEDVVITRVTILGNREPQFQNGYAILAGKFELLDAKGAVLATEDAKALGDKHDFDIIFSKPPPGIRAVRFTATKDDGITSCVGLSELQVE